MRSNLEILIEKQKEDARIHAILELYAEFLSINRQHRGSFRIKGCEFCEGDGVVKESSLSHSGIPSSIHVECKECKGTGCIIIRL